MIHAITATCGFEEAKNEKRYCAAVLSAAASRSPRKLNKPAVCVKCEAKIPAAAEQNAKEQRLV